MSVFKFSLIWSVFVLCVRAIPDECTLPLATGFGADAIERWYYNSEAGRCQTFEYTGCGGNANRWEDEVSCREYCEEKSGTCPALHPAVLHICERLCEFDSDCPDDKKCCSHSCGTFCDNPAKRGFCPDPASFSKVCVQYVDQCHHHSDCPDDQICCLVNGCGHECMDPADACRQPKAEGTCEERLGRWYYDVVEQACTRFTYSGCHGNDNIFASKFDCCNRCDGGGRCENECLLPADPGPCDGDETQVFYNTATGRCEKFTYGGCFGNENRFNLQEDCLLACDKTGYCPILPPGTIGHCADLCSGNHDCPGDQLCCSNGCGHVCKDAAPACQQPIVIGPCRAHISSWAFDVKSGDCQHFYYGGCDGNANRYKSRDECCKQCGCTKRLGFCPAVRRGVPGICIHGCSGDDSCPNGQLCCSNGCGNVCVKPALPCEQPIVVGPCRARISSWAYNVDTGDCEHFYYGGCGGNDNRYNSREECCRCCGCRKPGFCPAVIGAGICLEQCSSDGDCEGGDKCCSNGCGHVCVPPAPPCEQPIEPGPCEALNPSWGFNTRTGQCETFNYGGCQGNDNRYSTFEDCCFACGSSRSTCVCEAPIKIGPCRAAMRRWYFNINSGECEEFSWGGCQPNANNFPDEISCKARCGKRDVTCPPPPPPTITGQVCVATCKSDTVCKPMDVCCQNGCGGTHCVRPEPKDACDLPINKGECTASIQRWGYDQQLRECVQFTYGGCLGNINNFATKHQCQVACDCHLDRCYQGIDPGPCTGRRRKYKWGFDLKTGRCKRFRYGGHGGNDNRFRSKRQCKRKCRHAIKRKDHICYQSIEANPLIQCLWCNPHWAYVPCKNECVRFCRCGTDTDNAFKTRGECERHCVRDDDEDCEDDD